MGWLGDLYHGLYLGGLGEFSPVYSGPLDAPEIKADEIEYQVGDGYVDLLGAEGKAYAQEAVEQANRYIDDKVEGAEQAAKDTAVSFVAVAVLAGVLYYMFVRGK